MGYLRNMGFMGKNMPPRTQTKAGLFNHGDLTFNLENTAPAGIKFAESYIASTNGTLTEYTGGSDLTATLDTYAGNSSGDALYLPAGVYTVNTAYSSNFLGAQYSSHIFPSGYYGVFGADPDQTIILADVSTARRADNCLISWEDNVEIKFTCGYMTIRTKAYSTISYESALFHGTGSTALTYAYFKNVAINREGTSFSMLYDNNNDTGIILLENCSIGNNSGFTNNFSGSRTNKTAVNCLFAPNITTTQWGVLTDCIVNGTYFTVGTNGILEYESSTTGHRYNLLDTAWAEPT